MTHLHITTWVVALILLFVSYSLYSSGSAKGAKITHMILRLFYILIILTGAELFVRFANWNGEYAGKMILGIITIGLMEMLLIRKKKKINRRPVGRLRHCPFADSAARSAFANWFSIVLIEKPMNPAL